jgi:hypothetical protein
MYFWTPPPLPQTTLPRRMHRPLPEVWTLSQRRTHIYEVRNGGSYVKSEITLLNNTNYIAGVGLLLVPPFYYVVARGL